MKNNQFGRIRLDRTTELEELKNIHFIDGDLLADPKAQLKDFLKTFLPRK